MKAASRHHTDQQPSRQAAEPDRTSCSTPAALFADHRPEAIAKRTWTATVHSSPHMVAQRRQLHGLFGEAAQLKGGVEGEELLQGKFESVQRVEEEELLQGKFETSPLQRESEFTPKSNHTGLADNLKSGIESLSCMPMDQVKVHYNSSQPAQLNALAYTQGTDIHVAPGQERHLPHEAWHVVQQAQGRVQPTMQMRDGVPVNDDAGLEHEADMMGAKAAQMKTGDRLTQPDSLGVIQRARYSIEKKVTLTTAEKKWEGKEGQSAKKRAIGAMLAGLREEYPLPSTYTKTKDNNADDNFRGREFGERKMLILDRFKDVDEDAPEVTSTRASIEANKEAGKRKGTSQAAPISKIAPDVKWIGAHLIKREWGGADNMWNVVAWPQEAENKWADQFEKSVDTDGLYGRDPGAVSIAATKEDEAIDQMFIDEVEKFSFKIGLNNPHTADAAKKTGKFKEVVAKKRNYLNRAMESVPIVAAGTNKQGTTTLSANETRYEDAKECAKSEFADTVTDALADTSEVTRHKSDKTPIPASMEEAEQVEGGKRLQERQKDWREEKQNYRSDKYTFTNTLFPEE